MTDQKQARADSYLTWLTAGTPTDLPDVVRDK